jgi:hypothetical protein
VITLFKDAHNPSTIIHESAHFFLNNLREAASLENAPVWVRRAWQTVQQEYGITGPEIPRGAHERFARDFEFYAREGKAPSARLNDAFAKFQEWLTEIYTSVRDLLGGKDDISPSVRDVFDRLLATEEQLQARKFMDSLDWSTARADTLKPLAPAKESAGPLAEAGIDPQTHISGDELVLHQLDAEGRLSQADKDALLAHAAESDRINSLEERALGIAECVMQVAT